MAIIQILVAVILATAPGSFADDFEKYRVNQDVVSQSDRYTGVADTAPGMVVQKKADKVNPTRTLEHKSSDMGAITRLLDGQVAPLSGQVVGTCDIFPVEGDHLVVWWQDTSNHQHMAALVAFRSTDGSHSVLAQGEEGRFVCNYEPGKWYRVLVTMHVNAADGAKTRYDVRVYALGPGGKQGQMLGFAESLKCHGSPTSVSGTQVQSTRAPEGRVEARFDNWSLGPARTSSRSAR